MEERRVISRNGRTDGRRNDVKKKGSFRWRVRMRDGWMEVKIKL